MGVVTVTSPDGLWTHFWDLVASSISINTLWEHPSGSLRPQWRKQWLTEWSKAITSSRGEHRNNMMSRTGPGLLVADAAVEEITWSEEDSHFLSTLTLSNFHRSWRHLPLRPPPHLFFYFLPNTHFSWSDRSGHILISTVSKITPCGSAHWSRPERELQVGQCAVINWPPS